MVKDEMEVVSSLRAAIAERVGAERLQLWLRRDDALRLEGDSVVVLAGDDFTLERLRRNLRDDLVAATHQVLGPSRQVIFRVDNAMKRSSVSNARSRVAAHDPNQRLFAFAEQASEGDGVRSHSQAGSDTTTTKVVATRTAPIIAPTPSIVSPANSPASQGRRFARLDTFVAGDGNRLAYAGALKAAKEPGQSSPLYLFGPTGSGKTHLAEGIWSATRRTSGRQCVFLAAEQFTTMYLEGLHGQGLPSFRRKIREVDLLVIDDLQFLHGKRATLGELLATVEYFARERKQLVLTADRAPADLPGFGAELVARLSCGIVAEMPALDPEVRRGVLEQRLQQRGRRLPEEVLDLLARELPGDGRQLQGALNRLEAMQEATGRAIDVALTRDALKDLLRGHQKMIRLVDIEQAVCDLFGLSSKMLHSEAKSRHVTQPRMLAMWLARKHTRAGLIEISQHFGLKSHSTVVAAQRKVETWMQSHTAVGTRQGECHVEEAVRRIETMLRAAN